MPAPTSIVATVSSRPVGPPPTFCVNVELADGASGAPIQSGEIDVYVAGEPGPDINVDGTTDATGNGTFCFTYDNPLDRWGVSVSAANPFSTKSSTETTGFTSCTQGFCPLVTKLAARTLTVVGPAPVPPGPASPLTTTHACACNNDEPGNDQWRRRPRPRPPGRCTTSAYVADDELEASQGASLPPAELLKLYHEAAQRSRSSQERDREFSLHVNVAPRGPRVVYLQLIGQRRRQPSRALDGHAGPRAKHAEALPPEERAASGRQQRQHGDPGPSPGWRQLDGAGDRREVTGLKAGLYPKNRSG